MTKLNENNDNKESLDFSTLGNNQFSIEDKKYMLQYLALKILPVKMYNKTIIEYPKNDTIPKNIFEGIIDMNDIGIEVSEENEMENFKDNILHQFKIQPTFQFMLKYKLDVLHMEILYYLIICDKLSQNKNTHDIFKKANTINSIFEKLRKIKEIYKIDFNRINTGQKKDIYLKNVNAIEELYKSNNILLKKEYHAPITINYEVIPKEFIEGCKEIFNFANINTN